MRPPFGAVLGRATTPLVQRPLLHMMCKAS